MSTTLARLPLPLRLLNAGVAMLGPAGRSLISLDPDKLMSTARRTTGLDNYGSDYFRGPLERLTRSLEEDAELSALGRLIARQDLLRLLSNRLQLEDWFARHPEMAEQPIERPIFILGMPRTGTTSLHELMALDRRLRVPMSWEVAKPSPPPEASTYATDPRIAEVESELARIDQLLPDFKHMHPMGATLPQECVALFSHDFASMIFDVQFRLTQYQDWLLQEDMAEVFRQHRRWLQLLQWRCPGSPWVLKSPQYLWNIDDMLREYPDARIVQTHRDPVKVALSIGSLVTTLRSLGSGLIDLPGATREYADLLHYGVGKTMAARNAGKLDADRVFDLQFKTFRADPLAAVAQIYERFDLTLDAPTRERMQQFLAAGESAERHGRHQYSLEASGLDLARERERFADYEAAYNISREL